MYTYDISAHKSFFRLYSRKYNILDPSKLNSFQEGLALARQIGLRELVCLLLSNLGETIAEQGDYEQAEQHIREGLSSTRWKRDRLSRSPIG